MTESSEQTAQSSPENPTIDATTLFNAALKADQEGIWGDDGAQQESEPVTTGAEPSGERAPAETSGEVAKKDKAEPSAEQEKQQQELQRDEKGRFLPKQQAEPAETKPETPYSKAKKEEERQKSLLANFEKEKAEHRAWLESERQRLAQEKAQIERFKSIPRTRDGRPHEFTAQQYSKAADDFYERGKNALKEGDQEQAAQCFAQAEKCGQAAEQVAQYEQRVQQERVVGQHWAVWQQTMDAAMKQIPELQNPEHPLSKEVSNLLEHEPLLEQIPQGFQVAVNVAQLRLKAAEASALSEEVTKLRAENEDLRRRTGIRPAPATAGIPRAKSFDEMSSQEQAAWLRQRSAEEDRVPAYA